MLEKRQEAEIKYAKAMAGLNSLFADREDGYTSKLLIKSNIINMLGPQKIFGIQWVLKLLLLLNLEMDLLQRYKEL
jgi:hypothetical protein